MLLIAGGLTLICVFIVTLFRWRKRHFSYFKALGIPGPTPSLLWGNIREYHETNHFKVLDKWLRKYGDTFGFYDGDVPFIVTKDLDFLEHVLVRNFQNFTDRGLIMAMEQNHPILKKAVVHAGGPQWRSLRRAIAPGFSPAKLKQMMAGLKNGADIFLDIVEQQAASGQEVDVYHLYQRLAMDYVGRGAFGVDDSFQRGPENSLSASAKVVLRGMMTGPFHLVSQSTYMLGPVMKPLHWINMLLGAYVSIAFIKETAKIIELRRNNPAYRRPDVLQNLLDAEYREDSATIDNDTTDNGQVPAAASKSRALTTDEVVVSASALFIAGYDTTSTSLSYITYILAKHQDVQDKVRKEVNDAVSSNDGFDYETVTRKLPYLGQVINETLRLYPPALTFTTRTAVSDFEYNGVKYKAGTCIMSPTLQIHRDARYWPDPLTFNPDSFRKRHQRLEVPVISASRRKMKLEERKELLKTTTEIREIYFGRPGEFEIAIAEQEHQLRFSPGNEGAFHKMANQPFGVGPRNCVGMRMALLSLSFTIAQLVQRFNLELGPSQGEGPLDIGSRAIVSEPSVGPWIVFRRL